MPIPMYVKSFDGYDNGMELLTKFGVRNSDEITLQMSRSQFQTYYTPYHQVFYGNQRQISITTLVRQISVQKKATLFTSPSTTVSSRSSTFSLTFLSSSLVKDMSLRSSVRSSSTVAKSSQYQLSTLLTTLQTKWITIRLYLPCRRWCWYVRTP